MCTRVICIVEIAALLSHANIHMHTHVCLSHLTNRQSLVLRASLFLKSLIPRLSSNSGQVSYLSLTLTPPSQFSLSHTGDPGVFNITVTPTTSFSVDMYLLMDLTLTMVQDLSNLKTFAADLGIYLPYKMWL